jgi:dihydrofolate reductase
MREVVAALFISLDGVVEAPNLWQFDVFDSDMMASMIEQLATQDAVLLGRVTYEDWAPYWPTATDEPYASFINQTPKYIASTTLDSVAWGQFASVSLLKGDLTEAITSLKQQPGKRIGVSGSPTLVRSLIEQGLLDRLILMIHPVIAGSGRRLFEEGDALRRMRLVESQTTGSGVIIATYQPA